MTKRSFLVLEANRWVGIREVGGDNKGQIVELFQNAIDGVHEEPWCMSFVQYCLLHADYMHTNIFSEMKSDHMIWPSEHVMTVWRSTHIGCRLTIPLPGSIALWQYGDTEKGHTGIVSIVGGNGIQTVEGNTSFSDQRNGDGVEIKHRPIGDFGKFRLLGFLNPWPYSA